jgi:hypothetical protein
MNLIEQQNILRGLADDALKGEMGGGSVPPYLVLAEVNRRKSARERYEAANAKYRANQPTVAEELMGQKMPSGIDAAMPGGGRPMGGMMQGGMPTAGIDAAMPQQQAFANGGMVGYAEGGPVGYADGGLADLVSAYGQRLSGFDEDRKTAQKMALMNIGAQIMAGRSRNTLSNVGTGLSAALPSYQQSMERLNTQEMQAMRDQIDLARQMEQDKLTAEDRAYNRERTKMADDMALIPSWAQDEEALRIMERTDPERAAELRKLKSDLTAQKSATARAQQADEIIATVAERYDPLPVMTKEGSMLNPGDVDKARRAQEQDRINATYNALLAVGLIEEAKVFAERMSMSATAGADPDDPLAGATGKDPLGIRPGTYGVDTRGLDTRGVGASGVGGMVGNQPFADAYPPR